MRLLVPLLFVLAGVSALSAAIWFESIRGVVIAASLLFTAILSGACGDRR